MNGSVQLFFDRVIPGPYLKKYREMFLEKVLLAQEAIRKAAPAGLDNFELLTLPELKEIRRIWVIDKHEIEDTLPAIYQKCTGRVFPAKSVDDSITIGSAEMSVLKDVCGESDTDYEMTRALVSMAAQGRTGQRRAKLHDDLTRCFKRYLHGTEDEALTYIKGVESERAIINPPKAGPVEEQK
jgi:DNA sulfur modification protein DndC